MARICATFVFSRSCSFLFVSLSRSPFPVSLLRLFRRFSMSQEDLRAFAPWLPLPGPRRHEQPDGLGGLQLGGLVDRPTPKNSTVAGTQNGRRLHSQQCPKIDNRSFVIPCDSKLATAQCKHGMQMHWILDAQPQLFYARSARIATCGSSSAKMLTGSLHDLFEANADSSLKGARLLCCQAWMDTLCAPAGQAFGTFRFGVLV